MVIDTARKLGVRRRPLNFIKAFLSGRKYLIKTGKHCSREEKTNEIGVPQGAVLSSVLFNLAIAPLLWRLVVIPDFAFTVYADDITAWTMGSDNAPLPETTIQRALDVVSDFLKEVGLRPSPEETRYVAFGKGWENVDADLRFDGQKIDKVAEHSILGTVKLRRLRAHAAITPARTQRWERAARERKHTVDGASIAINHGYSLLPRKLRREEEACSKGCIYCTNHDVECDEHHLVWDCPHFDEERTKALDALDQQLRPTSFEAWCRPEGERDKRIAVLSGLLSYLSETGLDMHI
ncbi:hypothetical protein HPB47_005464 [Ixodes persulcatus]|uniref:Uncharacterized protein n=1 Tax=Ixodes persulcatus TaxID=34615 RepID=A0AC60PE48_IXOPE|nr:hypothetical protein HPB47_005464 [Ixodes persulcatus]